MKLDSMIAGLLAFLEIHSETLVDGEIECLTEAVQILVRIKVLGEE